jgi:hypothetical protein
MKKPEDNPDMKVLKTATCKTITGKSTLTYQIGALPDSTVHIRISNNSGSGFFNDEWISIKDIQKALADGPEGQPLTSFMLQSLLSGRSANTPAFIMAALTHERLLRVLKGKKRGHEFLDPEGFDAKMDKLVSAKAKPKGTTSSTRKKAVTRKAPSKKAVIKKRSVARKKQQKSI